MIKDSLHTVGEVTITLIDGKTEKKYYETVIPNLVVLVGRAFITARMKDNGLPTQMTHMELGQGITAPTAANSTIEIPFTPQARVALSTAGGTVNSNTITYTATFPPGVATGAVTEAGVFNGPVTGTMLCRTSFPVVNKPAGDILAISWSCSIIP